MILRQFLHADPVGASYLLGCGGRGLAAIVDPVGDPRWYADAAAAGGMRIVQVIDTHLHADHLSAARALCQASGADYVLQAGAEASGPFHGVRDGDELPLGNVSLRVWHTPGHTPEHLCLLVTDRSRADEPWCVLTGHTLMVGDLGRTEVASTAEQGARDLWHSARRLAALPDHVEVLPGAFAGSACGRGLSGKAWSTIGFERRHNPALQFTDEAAFIAHMTGSTPPALPDAAALRARNAGLLQVAGGAPRPRRQRPRRQRLTQPPARARACSWACARTGASSRC